MKHQNGFTELGEASAGEVMPFGHKQHLDFEGIECTLTSVTLWQ